jgi:heme/copper-type cytochrome/quinol oxidase subunit 4
VNAVLRIALWVIAVAQAVIGIAFALQLPFASDLWPFDYTQGMAFIFVGSIFVAAAAATLWCLWTREYGALAGIGLDYMVIFAPLGIFSLQIANGSGKLLTFAGLTAIGTLFGLVLFLHTRRIPIPSTPRLPTLVRVAFAIFIVALIVVGGQMVLKVPNIVPWTVNTTGSVIYGWMFLGAAVYFIYTLLRPSWRNAGGQLAGFLAYDVVLILPFLQRLGTVEPRFALSLWIYTLVVAGSGLLAAYYLFVRPETRVWGARRRTPQPAAG